MNEGNSSQKPEFDVISAIAMRDASAQDIAQQLRELGITSVEDVIDHLRLAADHTTDKTKAEVTLIDFGRLSVSNEYQHRRDTVQRVPEMPVLIDGTLYDPSDIRRFDGHELHFVVAPDSPSIVAISDRAVIGKWWEMIYVSSVVGKLPHDALAGLDPDRNLARSGKATRVQGQQVDSSHLPLSTSAPQPSPGPSTGNTTLRAVGFVNYYSDVNFGGWSISHDANRGYADLTRVNMGVFGLGSNWNDKISSVIAQGVRICVLHEHILWGGQSLSLYTFQSNPPEGPVFPPSLHQRSLDPFGWNDRASSVEGW